MRKLLLIILALLTLCSEAMAIDRTALERDVALLQAEYDLASKPQIYMVFDPSNLRVLIKCRGAVLKEIHFERIKQWGEPAVGVSYLLKESLADTKPERKQLAPGDAADKTPLELDFMDVKDMPDSYRMRFDGGMEIYVAPSQIHADTRWERVKRWGREQYKRLQWQFTDMSKARQEGYNYFARTSMEPSDARALYWANREGTPWLVLP